MSKARKSANAVKLPKFSFGGFFATARPGLDSHVGHYRTRGLFAVLPENQNGSRYMQIPHQSSATAMGTEILHLMKTRLTILKLLLVLCSAFATTAVFGQTNFTWTGAVDGTNLTTAGNFTTNGTDPATTLPNGRDGTGIQESVLWDGRTTSNLNLSYGNPGWPNTGFLTIGVNLVTTANQTNSVQINSPVAVSPPVGIFGITNNGAAAFILGDGTANLLNVITRPAGALHEFANNSAVPATINQSVRWQAGGGSVYTLDFKGAGNWVVNNYLVNDNAANLVQKDGSGTMTWTPTGYLGNGPLNSPITINAGTLVLAGSHPRLGNQAIVNTGTFEFNAPLQSQTLSGNISGTGQLQVNNGTLTLTGTNTYGGGTIVSGGKLVLQGSKSGSGNITVSDGATLGITDTGTQVTPDTLTVGTGSGATLEFNNVTNTTTAPLAPATLVFAGTITINLNSDAFGIGQSYPLLTWTSGSAPAVRLGAVDSAGGTLSTNGNTILFTVAAPLIWTGSNNGNWDTNTSGNWLQSGSPVVFAKGNGTLFDDSAPGATAVTVNTPVLPAAVMVSNNALAYSIASSGGNNIAGNTGLTKMGTGTLTLSGGANSYTGRTVINGGTLSVGTLANGGAASDIGMAANSATNLEFDGGSLQYTGGAASIDRSFTVGAGGGTIDASGSGPLTLNNPGTITLSGALTLAGSDTDSNTLAATLAGSGGLNKSGAGTWVLTGANAYGGGTTISGGVLQVGTGGGNGVLGNGSVTNNAALVLNRTGGLTVGGAISGTGSVAVQGGGTVVLTGDNTYSGGTTLNGGTLKIGNGGATGRLSATGGVVNNGTVSFYNPGSSALGGVISGTGSVTIEYPAGMLILNATNTYTGITIVNNGTLIVNGGNASSAVFVNSTLGGTGTLSGPVTLTSGTSLAPGSSVGSIGTLTFNNNLSLGGSLAVEVNKSLSPSNDLVVVNGVLANTGTGTVNVANLGSALQVGDKFTLFSRPMQNGAALTLTGSGATWANNLAVDGSISVTSVTRPALNFTQVGNNLQFSWNTNFGTFKLQAQTNGLDVGLGSNWADYPGGGTSPVTVPIDAMNEVVFFRLVSP
jgi:fibronectin-binding autotransporter adhesin